MALASATLAILLPSIAHAAPAETVFNSTALGFGGPVTLTINGVAYNAIDSGHYDNLGGLIQTNYQAGFDGFNNNPNSEVRNFFVFDLSSLSGVQVTSATVTIQ